MESNKTKNETTRIIEKVYADLWCWMKHTNETLSPLSKSQQAARDENHKMVCFLSIAVWCWGLHAIQSNRKESKVLNQRSYQRVPTIFLVKYIHTQIP